MPWPIWQRFDVPLQFRAGFYQSAFVAIFALSSSDNRLTRTLPGSLIESCSSCRSAYVGAHMKLLTSVIFAVAVLTSPNLFAQNRSSIEAQIRKWQGDVKRNPSDCEALVATGGAYGKLGQHATAVTYFDKAIAVNPSYAEAYLGLGSAYGFLGRPTEAYAALRKAVSLDPTNPFARAKLGTTLGKAGRYQEAATELREAIRLKPDLADAHFALGLAYVSLGDRRQAANEVNALSRIDPQLASRLQQLLGQSR